MNLVDSCGWFGLPLADSVVMATAQACEAVLWTQDSDFERIEAVQYRARA